MRIITFILQEHFMAHWDYVYKILSEVLNTTKCLVETNVIMWMLINYSHYVMLPKSTITLAKVVILPNNTSF